MSRGVPLLHDYLAESAARLPDKIALVAQGQRYTYAEIDGRANALANTLVAKGVARGDRVVMFGDNVVETVVSFWAALKANAVISVVNPLTKSDKLEYLLNDCRPTAFISDQHIVNVWSGPVARSIQRRCNRVHTSHSHPPHSPQHPLAHLRPASRRSPPRARPSPMSGPRLTLEIMSQSQKPASCLRRRSRSARLAQPPRTTSRLATPLHAGAHRRQWADSARLRQRVFR